MLVDANLLLYATDSDSPFHLAAAAWLTSALNGDRRVGVPWQSLSAFVRLATHPRINRRPLTIDEAWTIVEGWQAVSTTWHPNLAGPRPHPGRPAAVAAGRRQPRADAQLAALALEHGADRLLGRQRLRPVPEVSWVNPLR